MSQVEYRVVETSTVTDDTLSDILNQESQAGFRLDGIHFVPNEASRRPKMAFLVFSRDVAPEN
jgi:hypothetical protein